MPNGPHLNSKGGKLSGRGRAGGLLGSCWGCGKGNLFQVVSQNIRSTSGTRNGSLEVT
jgi:hypothetical protein